MLREASALAAQLETAQRDTAAALAAIVKAATDQKQSAELEDEVRDRWRSLDTFPSAVACRQFCCLKGQRCDTSRGGSFLCWLAACPGGACRVL